jgi:hypothetical protein
MAEERKNPKSQAWVFEQAKREIEQAEQALKVAETAQDKRNAREDLREAKERLAGLQRTTRRDRRADASVDQAQAAVDAAAKTPGSADDRKAQARLDEAKAQAGKTEERKDAARSDARESFYAAMGPQIAEAIKQFPELREFFRKAIEGRWDAAKQQRELNDPDNPWHAFWEAKGEYWRAGFQAQFGPNVTAGVWNDRVNKALEAIDAAALEKGVVLTAQERQNLARRYWYSEWSSDNDALLSWMQERRATKEEQGTNVSDDPDAAVDPLLPADRNTKIRELAALAEAYGLTYDQATLGMWADQILDTKKNPNGIQDTRFTEMLVQDSQSRYAPFSDQISADVNLRQIAGGYISEMARLLELSPADIRLTPEGMNPLLYKALTDVDPETGQPKRTPMWEFSKQIRQSDDWQVTDNARDTYMGAASKFARALGLAG